MWGSGVGARGGGQRRGGSGGGAAGRAEFVNVLKIMYQWGGDSEVLSDGPRGRLAFLYQLGMWTLLMVALCPTVDRPLGNNYDMQTIFLSMYLTIYVAWVLLGPVLNCLGGRFGSLGVSWDSFALPGEALGVLCGPRTSLEKPLDGTGRS